MKVPIRDLSAEGREIDEEIPLLSLGMEGSVWSPREEFRVVGRVEPVRDDIWVGGRIEGELIVACVLCLREFSYSIDVPFEAL